MPELPEVETIKLGLQKRIVGLKIQKVKILSAKSFQNSMGQPFDGVYPERSRRAQGLRGRKVLKVWRRAKILGMDLDKITLLIHLKMSGQLVWKEEKEKGKENRFIGGHPTEDMLGKMPNSHTRVIFSFSNGSKLYFNDQRRFGWVKLVQSAKIKDQSEQTLKNLGPEPLEKEFTWQVLKKNLLEHKNMPVKVAIMDQSIVSGVGNIYSNEACFNAKIDPRTKVGDLTDHKFQALYKGIIKALQAGIKYGGSTKVHFVDPEGNKGYFLDYAYVYGRNSHPCKKCETEIQKTQLGGRGTYFCPKCQTVVGSRLHCQK